MVKTRRIRELRPSDLNRMEELLNTRDEMDKESAKKRTELLKWIAFHNPYSNGEPTYFVVEDSNKIVAHLGRMPAEFLIKGNRHRGYFVHDLYVHPEYRKKGLGYFMSMDLYNYAEQNSDSFCCMLWTSPLNLKMQRLRKYHELTAYTYVKLLNPYPKLKKFVKIESVVRILNLILKFILRLIDFILLLKPTRGKILVVKRFGAEFDNLVQSINHKMGICSLKTADYFNWRYIDRPFNNRHVIGVEDKGQLEGVAILAITYGEGYPEGIIIDLIADSDNEKVLSTLCRTAIRYFRKKNVDKIDCCFNNNKIIKVLRQYLFFKSTSDIPLVLANLDKTDERDLLLDVNQWHLTYGESDKLMLSP